MGAIVITKQAAAQRLILSAVKMFERSDDPLAIHVVASSALNLLRELTQARGPNFTTLSVREGIFRAALSRAKGKPEPFLGSAEELDGVIDQIVQLIQSGAVKSAEDLEISGGEIDERKYLDKIIRPFNFLKHAQRDPLTTLDEGDVDPFDALTHAIGAFYFLFPGEQLQEEVIDFLRARQFI